MEAEFEKQYPGKHALWGGKETKAFIKFKEDMGKQPTKNDKLFIYKVLV